MNFVVLNAKGEVTGFFVVNSPSPEDALMMAKRQDTSYTVRPTTTVVAPSIFQNCLVDDVTLGSMGG